MQGNAFEAHCDPDIGSAYLDVLRLRQCMLHLTSNAAKFTKSGRIRIALTAVGTSPWPETIRIGAGGKLTPSLTITADGVSSKSTSATRTFGGNTVSLNQPYAARDGQMVWVFESGTLTNMSTQSQGGHIMKIAFSRGSGGLTCRISGAFARENGAGAISLGSTTHSKGAVEVISVRQAGSSCRVSK